MTHAKALALINIAGRKAFGKDRNSGYLEYSTKAEYKEVTFTTFVHELLDQFADCAYNVVLDQDCNTYAECNDPIAEICEGLRASTSHLLGVQDLAHAVTDKGAWLSLDSIDNLNRPDGCIVAGHTDTPPQTLWSISGEDRTLEDIVAAYLAGGSK